MTATELELKTNRFTRGMNLRQLGKAHKIIGEMMEDFLDAQAYDEACARLAKNGGKTVPWEKIQAQLEKQFPGLAKEAAA